MLLSTSRNERPVRLLALVAGTLVLAATTPVGVRADTTLDSGTTTVTTGTGFGDNLYVGYDGTAALKVLGGVAASSDAWLGYNYGSNGSVTVLGGTWANSGDLAIGFHGNGTLNVNGGRVTDHVTYLGYYDGIGVATVDSGTWDNSGILVVGNYGTGLLSINGGYLTNTYCWIGLYASSVGTATVASGTWVNSDGELYVGWLGAGTLTLSGGSVLDRSSVIGYSDGSDGSVTVSGGTWTNNDDLTVGRSGTGTLSMSGGIVTVGGTLSTGTAGTINLNAGGTLQIGTGGASGVLGVSSLTNNGTLIFNRSDASTYLGVISGSGAVTKDGSGLLTLSGSNGLTGPTTIREGVLHLANAAAISSSEVTPLTGGTLTLSPYLQTTVGGLNPNSGGLIDVGNGMVTVVSGLSSADLVAAIVQGYGGGSWNGTSGITSSAVGEDVSLGIPRAVGWLDNGDGSVRFGYAAPGDTNLDGIIDALDVANFLSGGRFNTGQASAWIEGDFNYDGIVDILDAAVFLSAGLYDTGPYNEPSGIAPEPSTIAMSLAGLACGGYSMWRRRNRARRRGSNAL